jgi:hypothetical protein
METVYGTIVGKDGKMFIFRKGILFATVNNFTACVIETRREMQRVGDYAQSMVMSYKFVLVLKEITIDDTVEAETYVDEITRGLIPVFDFQGIMKRKDGMGEKITFRDCIVAGAIDTGQLLTGNLDEMVLSVNTPPSDFEKFGL